MKPEEIQFALNLQALSAPQCRRIVEVLVEGSFTTEELSRLCKLTPASIEKHLEVLRESGLVKVLNREGAKEVRLLISKFKPTVEWFSKLNNL